MQFPNDYDPEFRSRRSPYATGGYPAGGAWQQQKTSALAILSLLSGLMAFPMMCLCFLSIPFSLFAIVSGHMARGIVRREPGQYRGIELASLGLLTGYSSLILTGLVLLYGFRFSEQTAVPPVRPGAAVPAVVPHSPSEILLEAAEAQLLKSTEPATFANDSSQADASGLAFHFVESLVEADALLFSEIGSDPNAEQPETDSAPPRTYRAFLQLSRHGAAVLLYVPELDRFTESAQHTLSQVAWLTAQRTLDADLAEGTDLAVAVYSSRGPENIMVGTLQVSDEFEAGLQQDHAARSSLYPFFPRVTPPPPPSPSAVEPSAAAEQSRIDNNPAVSELPVPAVDRSQQK